MLGRDFANAMATPTERGGHIQIQQIEFLWWMPSVPIGGNYEIVLWR